MLRGAARAVRAVQRHAAAAAAAPTAPSAAPPVCALVTGFNDTEIAIMREQLPSLLDEPTLSIVAAGEAALQTNVGALAAQLASQPHVAHNAESDKHTADAAVPGTSGRPVPGEAADTGRTVYLLGNAQRFAAHVNDALVHLQIAPAVLGGRAVGHEQLTLRQALLQLRAAHLSLYGLRRPLKTCDLSGEALRPAGARVVLNAVLDEGQVPTGNGALLWVQLMDLSNFLWVDMEVASLSHPTFVKLLFSVFMCLKAGCGRPWFKGR